MPIHHATQSDTSLLSKQTTTRALYQKCKECGCQEKKVTVMERCPSNFLTRGFKENKEVKTMKIRGLCHVDLTAGQLSC